MDSALNNPELLTKIVELADDSIIAIDEHQRIVLFNQGAERTFGYSSQEAVGKTLDLLLPRSVTGSHSRLVRNFAESPISARSMGERGRIQGRRKNGDEFPAEASISKAESEHGLIFMVILRDITGEVETAARLNAALHEKESLLREIHHRVKNNLQVVTSLLGLQARAIPDERIRKMFEESQNRIHSMALLHEGLYRSNDLAQIDFKTYIEQLASHLFHSYGIMTQRVRLRLTVEQLYLNLDTAVPCGLVINELVSNSLKYAFPDGRRGEIHIEVRSQPPNFIELTVADDGVGMASGFDQRQSLGLRLVRTLGEQLSASTEIRPAPGTMLRLTFPRPADGPISAPAGQ